MAKRVTHQEDYIERLAASIEAERAHDPDILLSWDWWRRQAELYGVTPNNIYSRAVNKGFYIPPSRRAASEKADETPKPRRAATPPRPVPSGAVVPTSAATRVLTERLQAMADVAGVLGEMEARISEMEREKEAGDARSREALRALDRLGRVLDEALETISALKQLYRE